MSITSIRPPKAKPSIGLQPSPKCGVPVPTAWRQSGSCDLPKGHLPAERHRLTWEWVAP